MSIDVNLTVVQQTTKQSSKIKRKEDPNVKKCLETPVISCSKATARSFRSSVIEGRFAYQQIDSVMQDLKDKSE